MPTSLIVNKNKASAKKYISFIYKSPFNKLKNKYVKAIVACDINSEFNDKKEDIDNFKQWIAKLNACQTEDDLKNLNIRIENFKYKLVENNSNNIFSACFHYSSSLASILEKLSADIAKRQGIAFIYSYPKPKLSEEYDRLCFNYAPISYHDDEETKILLEQIRNIKTMSDEINKTKSETLATCDIFRKNLENLISKINELGRHSERFITILKCIDLSKSPNERKLKNKQLSLPLRTKLDDVMRSMGDFYGSLEKIPFQDVDLIKKKLKESFSPEEKIYQSIKKRLTDYLESRKNTLMGPSPLAKECLAKVKEIRLSKQSPESKWVDLALTVNEMYDKHQCRPGRFFSDKNTGFLAVVVKIHDDMDKIWLKNNSDPQEYEDEKLVGGIINAVNDPENTAAFNRYTQRI